MTEVCRHHPPEVERRKLVNGDTLIVRHCEECDYWIREVLPEPEVAAALRAVTEKRRSCSHEPVTERWRKIATGEIEALLRCTKCGRGWTILRDASDA